MFFVKILWRGPNPAGLPLLHHCFHRTISYLGFLQSPATLSFLYEERKIFLEKIYYQTYPSTRINGIQVFFQYSSKSSISKQFFKVKIITITGCPQKSLPRGWGGHRQGQRVRRWRQRAFQIPSRRMDPDTYTRWSRDKDASEAVRVSTAKKRWKSIIIFKFIQGGSLY